MRVSIRSLVLAPLAALVLVWPSVALAQQTARVSGRLVNSLSNDPIPAAVVVLEELRRETRSAPDGTFTFDALPPGTYHVSVRADGYSSRRTELMAAAGASPVDVPIDPELHFEEVLSVSPEARSQFDSFQATTVLSGQELSKQLEVSLGETLRNQPGVSVRGTGPASARPVVRGLDGDRVLLLQDGQRIGDLSSQSADHGVTMNPAAARRIEIVRGPATLLYGSNAIGGLVNVITDEIPTRSLRGMSGNVLFDGGSAAAQAGTAADVHLGNGTVALHAGGGGRRSGEMDTPIGEIANSGSRNGFGNVGLAWTGARAYAGGSYGYDDTRYGIPVVEGGDIELTPRKHAMTVRAGGQGFDGLVDSFRASVAHRRYRHEEMRGPDVGTAFRNTTTEVQLMAGHRPLGRLKGSAGGWMLDRGFEAIGDEALTPPVDERGMSAFLYEELAWPHVTLQFGGRMDHTRFAPLGEPRRTFTTPSGSLGVLVRPARGNEAVTVALSVARTTRTPALEELFFFGPHPGNFAFDIGNPDLSPEKAFGVDLSLRWRTRRASGEVTYFRNSIADYIFATPLTEDEFEAREEEFEARFSGRPAPGGHGHGDEAAEFPLIEYVGADSLLQGIEAHTDVQVTSRISAEVGLDYVRGTLRTTGQPLPRIPPLRVRAGLRYQYNALQVGGEVAGVAAQDRVFDAEIPTDGYTAVRLFGAYSFTSGRSVNTLTLRLDNATNALYRNHLSRIKEQVPEMGRGVRLLYQVQF